MPVGSTPKRALESEITDASIVKDLTKLPSAQETVEDLAKDHTEVARRMHRLIELAEEQGDPVTAYLVKGRSAFHEEAAWMLRATAG